MAKATKVLELVRVFFARFFCLWLCFLLIPGEISRAAPYGTNPRPSVGAGLSPIPTAPGTAPSEATAKILQRDPEKLSALNDCNWIVTYRGRVYDLAPLTREALARPLETDIRYALQRVPQAGEHLGEMSSQLRAARAHSIIGSIFLAGVLATQLLKGGATPNTDRSRTLNIISYSSAAFSLAGFLYSWKATRAAKQELVQAVEAFNEHSSDKIEPAPDGRPNIDAPFEPFAKDLDNAEKNRP